jgi:hypothetical protein
MGLGLGAGAMAVVHEVCRWDRERRVAGGLGRGSSAAAAPAGRHRAGDSGELLERLVPDGVAAGSWKRPPAAIAEDIAVWQHTWAPEGARMPAQVNSWDLS